MTSNDIQRLLAAKHAEDVYIPECKDGPSQGYKFGILDGWAMNRSWAHPLYSGYEIKVARQDFIGDNKWNRYLPSCNCLSFVCPAGLISVSEVPEQCGLLWASVNGAKLYTKKKAPYREIPEPTQLLKYVMMCRVKVKREEYDDKDKTKFWRDWLETRVLDRDLGYRISKTLRKTVDERILETERVNKRLQETKTEVDSALAAMKEMGLDLYQVHAGWGKQRFQDSVRTALNGGEEKRHWLQSIRNACDTILKEVQE